MNDNATKVVGQAIDALKGSPLILAGLIFNGLVFGLVAWTINKTHDRHQQSLNTVIERCLPQAK